MTLLELLRQELPKRGGWPEGVRKISTHASGRVLFDGRFAPKGFTLPMASDAWDKYKYSYSYTNAVTREQYEATGWDGTGLPPVGCDVEYHCYPDGWVTINIVARIKGATFIEWKSGTHKGGDIIRGDFPLERVRPIRTEAERAIDEMVRLSGVSIGAAKILYDAGYRK